ncbi:MAG: replicative DNA helicase [Thermoanaerobacter sp.]|nr:replicative DNA helicase [Thermoanaerobacter sp.]
MAVQTNTRETRMVPQELDAEAEVLGCCIVSQEAMARAAEILRPGDFYHAGHATIFAAMLELYRSEPVTLIALQAKLAREKKLERIGGVTYLASLAARAVLPETVDQAARLVKEAARARAVLVLAEKMAARIYDGSYESSDQLINDFQAGILKLADVQQAGNQTVSIREAVMEMAADLELRYCANDELTGLTTGLRDLDKLTGGLEPGNLVIIAGRPSMGKTSLATGILIANALDGRVVVIFSTEVDRKRLARKLVAQYARVDTHKFRRVKELSAEEYAAILNAAQKLAGTRVFINDSPRPNPVQVRTECLKIKAKTGSVDLVLVDYIGMMDWPGKVENRNHELGKISGALKALAREMNCPVVVMSQLNRAVEMRQDKRPNLSDLRDSGNLEQDGDLILFLYRPEYYNPGERPGEVEIIVAKQKEGPTGSVWAVFQKEYTIFRDRAEEQEV